MLRAVKSQAGQFNHLIRCLLLAPGLELRAMPALQGDFVEWLGKPARHELAHGVHQVDAVELCCCACIRVCREETTKESGTVAPSLDFPQ